jgi:hypothetical protein
MVQATGNISVERNPCILLTMSRSAIYGEDSTMAMSRLRIVLNKREKALSSKEKRPHSEIVNDTVRPSSVSRMPFTAFCVRKKRRIKSGATTMARGIKVTVLVKMKRANPIRNHTMGLDLSFFMPELLTYLISSFSTANLTELGGQRQSSGAARHVPNVTRRYLLNVQISIT